MTGLLWVCMRRCEAAPRPTVPCSKPKELQRDQQAYSGEKFLRNWRHFFGRDAGHRQWAQAYSNTYRTDRPPKTLRPMKGPNAGALAGFSVANA